MGYKFFSIKKKIKALVLLLLLIIYYFVNLLSIIDFRHKLYIIELDKFWRDL